MNRTEPPGAPPFRARTGLLLISLLVLGSDQASKAAVHHLTRVLARKLGDRHVTVNAVAPGPFESKMMAATLDRFGDQIAASAPLGRIGTPEDIADLVSFLVSDQASYITGECILNGGGIN